MVSLFLESAIDLKEFKTSGRKEDAPENKAVFAVKCKYESDYINTLMILLEYTYLIFDIILCFRALEVMELFYRFKFYVNLQVRET